MRQLVSQINSTVHHYLRRDAEVIGRLIRWPEQFDPSARSSRLKSRYKTLMRRGDGIDPSLVPRMMCSRQRQSGALRQHRLFEGCRHRPDEAPLHLTFHAFRVGSLNRIPSRSNRNRHTCLLASLTHPSNEIVRRKKYRLPSDHWASVRLKQDTGPMTTSRFRLQPDPTQSSALTSEFSSRQRRSAGMKCQPSHPSMRSRDLAMASAEKSSWWRRTTASKAMSRRPISARAV